VSRQRLPASECVPPFTAPRNGDTVLVSEGVYNERLSYHGKAIIVRGKDGVPIINGKGFFGVLFCQGEGPESILKNFIITNSYVGIAIADSSPTICNVTVVKDKYGVIAGWAEPNISNSIFWNNTKGDLFGCRAQYSCIEEGHEGIGNIDIAPLFVDPNNDDYHVKSQTGRWNPDHTEWVRDEITSSCIDGGDPNSDWAGESWPNGQRVNMGAYGNTPKASMSFWPWRNIANFNDDYLVDFGDFAIFASAWMAQAGDGSWNYVCDISYPNDRAINGHDLAMFADNWLECAPPPGYVSFREYWPFAIEADAWCVHGPVVKMEFFVNENKIGEDNDGSNGWSIDWDIQAEGNYSLTVQATNNYQAIVTSPAVEFTVEQCGPGPL